jgi:hypothetical protein
MLTLVSYIAVNQFRETDEPAIDPRALAAPAAVRLH